MCPNGSFAIELEDVRFRYDSSSADEPPAIDGLSLKIKHGECICVTGPSGCGKTTLTRLMNGLIPTFYEGQSEGEIRIEGIDLDSWSMDELCRHVGSVFQNPRSQFFNLDTTSELAYGCENLGISRKEILHQIALATEELGLQNLLNRDIHDLSGGQRQLLALGTVCAMGADILILDEPTANLDAAATRAVKRALQGLKKRGETILIVEHRLHWLEGLVDRVIHMDKGRVIHNWSASEISSLSNEALNGMGLRSWKLGWGQAVCSHANLAQDGATEVQADGIRARYGSDKEILNGASFVAQRGHVIAIIGRNGQGKSTLARVIAGLMRETYGGISLDAHPLSIRDRVGKIYLVLQESGYQLFGSSVLDEFFIGFSKPDDARRAEARSLIERFGLSGKESRHPASLSGGEMQRLAMAVGVYAGAKLLVLDEPTSGLDLESMRRCAREIKELAATGRCVFVITHDAEFVSSVCDSAIEIGQGRVLDSYPLNDEGMEKAMDVLTTGSPRSGIRRRNLKPTVENHHTL